MLVNATERADTWQGPLWIRIFSYIDAVADKGRAVKGYYAMGNIGTQRTSNKFQMFINKTQLKVLVLDYRHRVQVIMDVKISHKESGCLLTYEINLTFKWMLKKAKWDKVTILAACSALWYVLYSAL
ncbi:hypothetical protein Btru_001006 [Bulinus truncatus]|nr:hypothetical protein Btru_001006 [Bulinus truncatus]